MTQPRILQRPDHPVSRKNVDPNALKVLYRLDRSGFEAYLVGGGVRDLMLGRRPKDYDVATNARPQEIRRLFRNSRIIGRRFRLAHVYFRQGVIEVSTFRGAPDPRAQRGGSDDLLVTNDNTFGTPQEDAFRRDFTVNALYYRISDFAIVDYVGGVEDLERRVIRVIGEPDVRFREDPVRMLRACELAARLGFGIDAEPQRSIRRNRQELARAAAPRLLQELLQILRCGSAGAALQWMLDLGLLDVVLPELRSMLDAPAQGLGSFDQVISVLDGSKAQRLDDVVLLAAILAPTVLLERHRLQPAEATGAALSKVGDRDLVHSSIVSFMERLGIPNAKARGISRSLEVLLRLEEVPTDRWERLRLTRHVAFNDALQVFNILVKATGKGDQILQEWRTAMRDTADIPSSERPKKRRRRRRPRRRKRQS